MTKYLRTRHVPLNLAKPKAVQQEIDDFMIDTQEAGSFLQALRESRGWSHRELGERVGLNSEYVALMEKGERPITPAFAKMFGDLFDIDYRSLL